MKNITFKHLGWVSISLMVIITSLSLTGCGSDKKTLTIGSDVTYPPFEYRENGEITGFDIDLAREIFKKQLGHNIRIKHNSFDTIIPQLQNGQFRVIVSAMTITDKRAKKVDFSDPYFTAYQTVVVLNDSDISDREDLRGKVVGVEKGTTGKIAAVDLKNKFDGDLQIKKFDSSSDTFNGLLNNQVEAVIMDNMACYEQVHQNKNLRFVQGKGKAARVKGENAPPYLTLTVEKYGFAFRKGDDELRKNVNRVLKKLKENGTYDKIFRKYFPEDLQHR